MEYECSHNNKIGGEGDINNSGLTSIQYRRNKVTKN